MTVESLAIILCASKVMFSHPQVWDQAQCTEKAQQIIEAAQKYDIDPKLIVAGFVQECDLVNDITRPIYDPNDLRPRSKRNVIGHDYCPMGVRIYEPGPPNRQKWTDIKLFEKSASKMDFWRRWCTKKHAGQGHHWLKHYNEGNPDYVESVMAIKAAIFDGKEKVVKDQRTNVITQRMVCAHNRLKGQKTSISCPKKMLLKIDTQSETWGVLIDSRQVKTVLYSGGANYGKDMSTLSSTFVDISAL